ncbi:autotransporter outer membrane beta-barrel domain-containing protein [uncultured Bartonella sp.]|uniref:autotransporter family protein n=1 Tax=uncultured Bartonella sp. TaxID=104108 RepID=UPI0025E24038|nr:autotransporter outer membrane beta-barrel domain-containing protein [uncultured Bartonella sp.]
MKNLTSMAMLLCGVSSFTVSAYADIIEDLTGKCSPYNCVWSDDEVEQTIGTEKTYGRMFIGSGTYSLSGPDTVLNIKINEGAPAYLRQGSLYVGNPEGSYNTHSSLIINDHAKVNLDYSLYIGGDQGSDSSSTVVLDGGSTLSAGSVMNAGGAGTASLVVKGASVINVLQKQNVSNGNFYNGVSAFGTTTISGEGSQINVDGLFYASTNAEGIFNIENNGELNTKGVSSVGEEHYGQVNIIGGRWNSSSTVNLYKSGEINISDGGILTTNIFSMSGEGENAGRTTTISLARGGKFNILNDITTYYTDANTLLKIASGSTMDVNGKFNVGGVGASRSENTTQHHDIVVDGDGSLLTVKSLSLAPDGGKTNFTLSNNGRLKSSGDILLTDTNVNSTATLNIGAAAGKTAAAAGVVDATNIRVGSGTSTINFNHTSTDYNFSSAITEATSGATNGTINQIAGHTRLTADSSGFGGQTNVAGGSLIVNGSLGGNLSVDTAGILEGLGNVGNVTNAGIVSPGDGKANIGTLKINGNYVGNGGSLLLDTVLGNSHSLIDQLMITGDASGTTSVTVTNRGGLGALTTGNGIEVITVGGTSTADAFALKSDYQFEGQNAVVGGAYAYSLYHGIGSDGSWYLRTLDTTYFPSIISGNPTHPSSPVYQPGVPLYEVYPQVLQQMNKLGTLEQRVGNRTWLEQHENGVDAAGLTEGRGFWMKVEVSASHINSDKSKTNANYDLNIVKTQLGLDFEAIENTQGTFIGGVYFQYGHAKGDISSRFGEGDIKADGYGLGGTLTWYDNNGFYVDSVAQAMWYESDIDSDTLDRREIDDNKGTGYSLSVEAGKKIAVANGWNVTPQAQLSYSSVDFDSFHDVYKARVSRNDGDALTGRLGVAFDREKAWKSAAGDVRRLKVYGIANLYYEFLDGTQVEVTGVKFRNQPDRFWGGLGAGLSHDWKDDKYSLYGEVAARSSFNDFGNSYSLNGTVGFRAKF